MAPSNIFPDGFVCDPSVGVFLTECTPLMYTVLGDIGREIQTYNPVTVRVRAHENVQIEFIYDANGWPHDIEVTIVVCCHNSLTVEILVDEVPFGGSVQVLGADDWNRSKKPFLARQLELAE